MLISHDHKFIFLKTRKTAGTSIECSLSRYILDGVVTPVSPKDEELRRELGVSPFGYSGLFNPLYEMMREAPGEDRVRTLKDILRKRRFYNHISALKVRGRVGKKVWDSYFKFCFDRNPWDKTLSHYYWKKRNRLYENLEDYLLGGNNCSDYGLYSIDGEVAVDFVGRYETIGEDLRYAMKKVGIDFDGWLPTAKGGVRPKKSVVRESYDEKMKEQIGELFSKEIDLLGYEFPWRKRNDAYRAGDHKRRKGT